MAELQAQETIQFYQMLQSLKRVNLDKLDSYEREKLKALSEQYKYHMQQFQDYQMNLSEAQFLS